MKKINTGIIITTVFVKLYITISRIWAIGYMAFKTVRMSTAGKSMTVAEPTATKTA